MKGPRHRLAFALLLNAAAFGAIAAALWIRPGGIPSLLPAAYAQNQGAIAGGAGIFIMPGQFSQNTFGCYLLDVDSQTLAAYQYYPGEKELRLVAARTYKWDRKLENYNSPRPSPAEVEELVKKQQNAGRLLVPQPPTTPDAPTAPRDSPPTAPSTP